jgi:hypothetical protein
MTSDATPLRTPIVKVIKPAETRGATPIVSINAQTGAHSVRGAAAPLMSHLIANPAIAAEPVKVSRVLTREEQAKYDDEIPGSFRAGMESLTWQDRERHASLMATPPPPTENQIAQLKEEIARLAKLIPKQKSGTLSCPTRDSGDTRLERLGAMLRDGRSIRDIAEELCISKSAVHRLKKQIGDSRK